MPSLASRGGASPRGGASRPFIPVLAAFTVIGAGFFASTLYGEIRASDVDREVAEMEANSIPSVEHLAAAEGALRRFEVAIEDYAYTAAKGHTPSVAGLDAARTEMRREVASAEATPMYPGEAELTSAANLALAELDDAVGRLEQIATAEPSAAESFAGHEVRGAIDRTDAAFDRVLTLNAKAGHAGVARIVAVRRSSRELAIGLDLLCMVFSALAALVAFRALKSRAVAERAYQSVLETRAEELEIFARRVAHDLLSPLSALAFTLSTVKRNGERGLPIDEPLQRAGACLQRSQRLVHGVLNFARSAASLPGERANLRETIDGVLDEVRAEEAFARSGVRIEVIVPEEEALLPCSPGILASVVSNLLRNAVKYVSEGTGEKRVTVRAVLGPTQVRVEVEDTGPGLPPEIIAHLFEPYYRGPNNAKPGLGLGLATVRRFVEAHRGEVGVTSSPGRGSTFWFDLPRVAARESRDVILAPEAIAPETIPSGNGVTGR